jgi:hypothetical protein
MFHVSYYSLSYSCQFYTNMYLWMSEIQWWVFSCQYAKSRKIGGSGFINRMFWFYKPDVLVLLVFAWQNWMVRFAKPDCPVLVDLAYVSSFLFVMILLSCASHNSSSHTQIIAHIGCIHIGGNSLGFPWKMCNMATLDQIWILFNMHIIRGS